MEAALPDRGVLETSRSPRRGTIGVLQRGDRYLLVRRAEELVLGGAWCFPGGHVDPGENSRRAIVRELREELGIEVVPGRRLEAVRVGGGRYVLAVWLIEFDGSPLHPNPAEIADTAWRTIEEIRVQPGGLPSNESVLRMLEGDQAARGGRSSP